MTESEVPHERAGDQATDPPSWPAEVAYTIARQILYWRRRRKLSAQRLADRTKALGHEVPRSVIANLENKRRSAIGFVDVLALAAALDIPPILLFAPIGLEAAVEILPGIETSAWEARGWFHGAIDPPYSGHDSRAWQGSRRAIALYDIHRSLVRQLRGVETQIQRSVDQELPAATAVDAADILFRPSTQAAYATELLFYIDRLRTHRRLIAAEGFVLPELPADIAIRMGEDTSSGRHRRGGHEPGQSRELLAPVFYEQLRPRLPTLDETVTGTNLEPPEE